MSVLSEKKANKFEYERLKSKVKNITLKKFTFDYTPG